MYCIETGRSLLPRKHGEGQALALREKGGRFGMNRERHVNVARGPVPRDRCMVRGMSNVLHRDREVSPTP